MLAEQRFAAIMELLYKKQSVTVAELVDLLHSSESTIRRDLSELEQQGRLKKVFGGATLKKLIYEQEERSLQVREERNIEEKKKLAQKASELVEEHDFVYLDAGTTVCQMAEHLPKDAVYVTNGVVLAQKLALKGFQVFLLGGELKAKTMAIIGSGAIAALQKYNFTKAFFGTNGVSLEEGYTTVDLHESYVKSEAMRRSRSSYILADSEKFSICSSITFAQLCDAVLIAPKRQVQEYKEETEVIEVEL